MRPERVLEQRLDDWLADGPEAMPDRLVAEIMNAVPLQRQERTPAWIRLLSVAPAVAAVAAGVIVVGAAMAFLTRDRAPAAGSRSDLIAFSSDASGTFDIWTVDPATGATVQLTDTPARDSKPAWSPDGRAIAFARDAGLWVMSADGNDQRLLTPGVEPEGIDWSPDGRTIAYGSNRLGAQIRAVNPDGSDDRVLLELDAPFACCPSWSPDGDELVIAVDEAGDGGAIDLYIVRAADGRLRQLTTAIGDDTSPAWSRAADRIVFQSDATANLSIIAPDGSELEAITRVGTRGVASAWSPTADRIAWIDQSGELNAISLTGDGLPDRIPVPGRANPSGLAWRP